MVFQVKGNQQLSQTNVKSLSTRCIELISKAACLDSVRKEVITPVLEFYAGQTPSRTLANDSVFLTWQLLRQGTMPCMILNNFRSGILDKINKLDPKITEEAFQDAKARSNVKSFIEACKGDLYMTDDQLFTIDALYTNDTNTLLKAVSMIDGFFTRIAKIQAVNFEKKILELRENDKLYSIFDTEVGDGEVPQDQKNLRLRVIHEILDTEKKYVADLDKLQGYAEELRMDGIISPEAHATLFANLDKLVDFQRRFLMQMEAKITKSVLNDVQASYKAGIAQLFLDNEKGFIVYETFCPNFKRAADTVVAELPNLMKKQRIMDPNVELNAYLIKPTQRICKYPLLLRELMKMSEKTAPDREDLEAAWLVVDRVTKNVNERKRREEMNSAANELYSLVKDWKNLDKTTFGLLLLHNQGSLVVGDSSKESEFYLFENILLVCGQSKSMAYIFLGSKRMSKQQLVIKGLIQISQIIAVSRASADLEGNYLIKITFKGIDVENWTFKFKMEEQAQKWSAEIESLMERGKPEIPAKPTPQVTPSTNTAKDRKRRTIMALKPVIPPSGSSATTAKQMLAAIPNPDDEPIKLKVIFNEDIMIDAVYEDITSLDQLKVLSASRISRYYKRFNKEVAMPLSTMELIYVDEQKDEINLYDDQDVVMAMLFSPIAITIKVKNSII